MVGSTENHLHLRDGDAEHSLNFTSIHPSALFCFLPLPDTGMDPQGTS